MLKKNEIECEKIDKSALFQMNTTKSTRNHGWKLIFYTDTSKHLFGSRAVNYRNSLQINVVSITSNEIAKTRLDKHFKFSNIFLFIFAFGLV